VTQLVELDPCVSRTVQPRKLAKPCTRQVLAVHVNTVCTEEGAWASVDEYARALPWLPPHIVVCYSPDFLLQRLHEHWQGHSLWSWRVATTNHRGKALQTKRVAYYGFRDPNRKRNSYHIVIDANSFIRKQDAYGRNLLTLGTSVRAFCNAFGLEVRASAAGVALQLLRHPAFYPFARRRVPHFINEAVRPHLPGGYYESYSDAKQRLDTVLYVDQEAAHHYAAETTPLPNANSVRAIGYTRADKAYARKGGVLYRNEIRKHGLVKALVYVPPIKHAKDLRFAPRVMHKAGEQIVYLWTNELPLLESYGLEVRHLIAMWGTEEVDHGLAKYAQWARQAQRDYPALKALLLMPYGLLARRRTNITFHSPGETDSLILATQPVSTKSYRTVGMPDTANALQLGLIQSFVRALSLDMARQLTAQNHEVVSIYADGVFVRLGKDGSVPLFSPWRMKEGTPLELSESMRVPVRAKVRREYLATNTGDKHDE
jgi:hypothetical protein